jgi:MurNAc alpha-1-phosphate uridylyltransferase
VPQGRTRIDKALVLAAGLGQRMRPLTDRLPKPLVPLAGRPLIDHVLDAIAAAGIGEAVVNLHYRADQLERHLAQRASPVIRFSDERDLLLDTGGGLKRALPLLGERAFVVHNSDSVSIEPGGVGFNVGKIVDAWDDTRMDALLLLAERSCSIGFDGPGDFFLEPDGRLRRRGNAPSAPFVFAGISIASPRLLEGAPDGAFSLNLLWDRALAKSRVLGAHLEGLWMHIGTPEALIEAERAVARNGGGLGAPS